MRAERNDSQLRSSSGACRSYAYLWQALPRSRRPATPVSPSARHTVQRGTARPALPDLRDHDPPGLLEPLLARLRRPMDRVQTKQTRRRWYHGPPAWPTRSATGLPRAGEGREHRRGGRRAPGAIGEVKARHRVRLFDVAVRPDQVARAEADEDMAQVAVAGDLVADGDGPVHRRSLAILVAGGACVRTEGCGFRTLSTRHGRATEARGGEAYLACRGGPSLPHRRRHQSLEHFASHRRGLGPATKPWDGRQRHKRRHARELAAARCARSFATLQSVSVTAWSRALSCGTERTWTGTAARTRRIRRFPRLAPRRPGCAAEME